MVRKALLVFAAATVAVLGAAGMLLALRGSAIADLVRTGAEARLSAALGQPVTIGEIGFSLRPHPAFTGTSIRIGAADQQAPAVQLDRVQVFPEFRSFLSGPVHITEVLLDGFTVSLLRDAGGRWRVPTVFPAPAREAQAGVAVDRVRIVGGRLLIFDAAGSAGLRETSRIEDIRGDLLIESGGLRVTPLTGRVGGAAIDGGARIDSRSVRLEFASPAIGDADLPAMFGLLAASRPAVLRLDRPAAVSVTVTIDRETSRLTGNGTLKAPALTVEPLSLQRLEAPFVVQGSQLTFTPTTFVLNEGSHVGRFTLTLGGDAARWSTDARIEGLDIGALLDTIAGRDAKIDGRGRIDLTLQGRFESGFLNRMDGRARLLVKDGVLHDFPLLATVNRALRLSEGEGNDTRFEQLTTSLAIGRGVAATDDLVIQAGHLRADLAGRIGFDRSVDLRGHAVVSAARATAAVASVHELARLRNARGEMDLPLTITGSLDAPRFALDLESAIRGAVKDELMRRLRRILPR